MTFDAVAELAYTNVGYGQDVARYEIHLVRKGKLRREHGDESNPVMFLSTPHTNSEAQLVASWVGSIAKASG
jgi:hypothetical protein